jgi:hypothetical protein
MIPDPPGEHAEMTGGWRAGLSRRSFLRRGTFTAATVAVASSIPGLSTLVSGATADAPVVETGASDVEMDSGLLSEPLVAHVKDLSTGEISLFQGEREVVVRSPALARGLMSAARP